MTAPPRIGSLFSGYGGLDMAVEATLGGSVVWHAEIEDGPAAVLERHWPDVPNLGDITAVDWTTVEPVDVLTGGFPCQDVSHAGKRAGLRPGTRSGLWQHFVYAITQLRPAVVVIENVRGLLSAKAHSNLEPCPWCVGDGTDSHMRALGAVLSDLANLGYDARWCGLRAADVGAPHGRYRVFILAFARDTPSDGIQGHGATGLEVAPAHAEQGVPLSAGDVAAADAGRDGLREPAVAGEDGREGVGERAGGETLRACRPVVEPSAADALGEPGGERRGSATGGEEGRGALGQPGGRGDGADSGPGVDEGRGAARGRVLRGGSSGVAGEAAADADDGGRGRRSDEPVGGPEGREAPRGDSAGHRGDVCGACGDGEWLHDADGFCAGDCGGDCAAAADTASLGRGEGEPEPAGVERGHDAHRGGPPAPTDPEGDQGRVGDGDGLRAGRGTLGRGPDAGRGAPTDADVDGLEGQPAVDRAGSAAEQRHADGLRLEVDRARAGQETPADPDSAGRRRGEERDVEAARGHEAPRGDDPDGRAVGEGGPDGQGIAWGDYEPAIRRWERIVGRPAPVPHEVGTRGQPRLSPAFVEWMMGLPAGHVTDVGISRKDQLKALGNGVVPQQAYAALLYLLDADMSEAA